MIAFERIRNDEPTDRKKPRLAEPTYVWERKEFEKTNVISDSILHSPYVLQNWSNEKLEPIDIFKEFWNFQIMERIRLETNHYHYLRCERELGVSIEELYKVFGILLLSGYIMVSRKDLYS